MNLSTFDGFMMTFWGTLIGCLCIIVFIHLAAKTILTRKFANPIKKKVLLALIVLILPSLFLTVLSVFDLHLYINQAFHSLPKLIKKIIFPIINHIVSFSQTLWPKYALAATISGFLAMVFLPKLIERNQNPFLKHLIYTILSLGLYLPYKLFGLLFDHSSTEVLKRGTKVIHNPRESVQILKKKVLGESKGIKIHPDIRISLEMETKHILTVATIGAGKTQIIFPIVEQILVRGDRALIYDRKGDYTEAHGQDSGVKILSPFDSRGIAWDIGKDISSEIMAEEFAAALIPKAANSHDSIWYEAAQDVTMGAIKSLQTTKHNDWNFRDLHEILTHKEKLIDACKTYYPGALMNLGSGGNDDKQTSGVLMTIRTAARRIGHLATAWKSSKQSISLKDWVKNADHEVRTLIIGGNPRFPGLDGFLVTQIFNLVYSEILSLPDSRTRRLWTINDEQGSQPKIPMMLSGLTEGRSKGLRIVSAVQAVSQIRSIYGRDNAEVWFNSFGTLLAGRVGDHETASFLARNFGQNRIEKISTSLQENAGSISRSRQGANDPALLDSDFLAIPNPSLKRGIEFWLRVAGWPACKLIFPIKETSKKFQSKIEPLWIKDGYQSSKGI